MEESGNNNDQLFQFKELITSWLTAHLEGLRNGSSEQDLDRIKEIEHNIGAETMRLLHENNVDTTNVENALSQANLAFQNFTANSPSSVNTEAINNLRNEILTILNLPEVSALLENLRTYCNQIFGNPTLRILHQDIYGRCLQISMLPPAQQNIVIIHELRNQFIIFLEQLLSRINYLRGHQNGGFDETD